MLSNTSAVLSDRPRVRHPQAILADRGILPAFSVLDYAGILLFVALVAFCSI